MLPTVASKLAPTVAIHCGRQLAADSSGCGRELAPESCVGGSLLPTVARSSAARLGTVGRLRGAWVVGPVVLRVAAFQFFLHFGIAA